MRHAKAEPFSSTDRARRLTDRGRAEAARVGSYLRERGIRPEHAVVSSAERTRQTWQALEETLGCGATAVFDDAVYSGSTDVLLEALRAVPEDVLVLAFVGHQPTVGSLAHLLEDGEGDQEALHRMLHGFPPASVAVFEVEGSWEELGPERGRLVGFRPGGA
jgi:phosphohistidine phosphatase